jgi:hypothetical protein
MSEAFPRDRGVLVRVLMLAAAILLLAESWRMLRLAYALLRIHQMYFPTSPYLTGMWTDALWGTMLMVGAGLCLMRRADVLRWCMVPAVGLLFYGIWNAFNYGRSMIAVSGAMEGDDIALGFLGGLGFIAIGGMMLIARWLGSSNGRGSG